MIRLLSYIILSSCIYSESIAQTFDLSVPVGLEYTRMQNKNLAEDVLIEHKTNLAPNLGLAFHWMPKKTRVGVQIGLNYWNGQQKLTYTDDSLGDYERKFSSSYLQFRAGFEKYFEPLGLSLAFGIQPGLLVGAYEDRISLEQRDSINFSRNDILSSFEDIQLSCFVQLVRVERMTEKFSIRHGLIADIGIIDILSAEGGRGFPYRGVLAYTPTKWLGIGYQIAAVFSFE